MQINKHQHSFKQPSFTGDVTNSYIATKPGIDFKQQDQYQKLGSAVLTVEDDFDTFKSGDTIKVGLWEKNDDRKGIIVLGDNKRAIGRCQYFNFPDKIKVENIINEEDYNVKGVGSTFFQYLTELSLKLKKQICLDAFNENESPVPFYNKIGFLAENDKVQKEIENDIKHYGFTDIENIQMKSSPKLYEHFKENIMKTPFIAGSEKRLNDFLKSRL